MGVLTEVIPPHQTGIIIEGRKGGRGREEEGEEEREEEGGERRRGEGRGEEGRGGEGRGKTSKKCTI